MIAMSEEAKVIAFVAFCVASYKAAKNLSGEGVSSLFTRFGVDRYLYEEYEVLHTEKSIGLLKFVRSEEVTWVK